MTCIPTRTVQLTPRCRVMKQVVCSLWCRVDSDRGRILTDPANVLSISCTTPCSSLNTVLPQSTLYRDNTVLPQSTLYRDNTELPQSTLYRDNTELPQSTLYRDNTETEYNRDTNNHIHWCHLTYLIRLRSYRPNIPSTGKHSKKIQAHLL